MLCGNFAHPGPDSHQVLSLLFSLDSIRFVSEPDQTGMTFAVDGFMEDLIDDDDGIEGGTRGKRLGEFNGFGSTSEINADLRLGRGTLQNLIYWCSKC